MPAKKSKKRSQSKKQSTKKQSTKQNGKSASSKAGEYVREEMHDYKHSKSGPQSRKQAIAIGLSKARQSGIRVPKKSSSRTSHASRSH